MAFETLASLKSEVRFQAQVDVDGDFVPDDQLRTLINRSWGALWNLMIDGDCVSMLTKNAPNLAESGDYSFQLPSDFYKIASVRIYDGSHYRPALRADAAEYPELTSYMNGYSQTGYYDCGYSRYLVRAEPKIGEKHIYIFPKPTTFAVMYVPEAPKMVLDSDGIDAFENWSEFVVVDSVIKILERKEADVRAHVDRKNRIIQRIYNHARDMDTSGPPMIREITHSVWENA